MPTASAAPEQLPESYRALRVELAGSRAIRTVVSLPSSELPDHDVTVRVSHSSLNYKDALSASGNRGVSKSYPHTPGIDAAGVVITSRDPRFSTGTRVLVTGYDLGMNTPGGLAELIRVPGDWLLELPAGLDARSAMALGTAGFTAALALRRLQAVGAGPELGPFVVTGASGGVGCLAVALLARAGYEVVASTGKAHAAERLLALGAARCLARQELAGDDSARPLAPAVYGGGIDTIGAATLAGLVKRTVIGGAVAACGLVGGSELALSVFPFVLRGVSLLGVDSQHTAMAERREVWRLLAGDWRLDPLGVPGLVNEVGLEELEGPIRQILAGDSIGRVLVRL